MDRNSITGIVLCGGKSQRMGSNKALLQLGKYNLLEHSINLLQQFSDTILISTGNANLSYNNLKTVTDVFENIGPISGIYSSLSASKTEHNIIVSCDMPFISPECIAYLIARINQNHIVLPQIDGFVQSLTGYFNKQIVKKIEAEIEKNHFKPIQLFRQLNAKIISIEKSLPFYSEHLFFNINTEEDYKRACELAGEMF
jgi:molybdenum cofactor guanylyltransferase